jgi:ChaB/Rho termination factor, N-terminal domain
MPGEKELASTLKRSPEKAQRTWAKTHDSAVEQYGEGERAHRTAYGALKHSFEKVGDHWEPKEHPGPSDPRSVGTTAQKRRGEGETFGGVDVLGHSRDELMQRARDLGIRGRSRMSKTDLAAAIARRQ